MITWCLKCDLKGEGGWEGAMAAALTCGDHSAWGSTRRSADSLVAADSTPPYEDEDHELELALLGVCGQSLPCHITSLAHSTLAPHRPR